MNNTKITITYEYDFKDPIKDNIKPIVSATTDTITYHTVYKQNDVEVKKEVSITDDNGDIILRLSRESYVVQASRQLEEIKYILDTTRNRIVSTENHLAHNWPTRINIYL